LSDLSRELNLKVATGQSNPDTVFLTETDEKPDPLLKHPIPGVTIGELQILALASGPLTFVRFRRYLVTPCWQKMR
jgi:hypothetical protein